MREKLFSYVERGTAGLLYLSIVLMLFATGASEYFPYGVQSFLVAAILFCMGTFFVFLHCNKILYYVKNGMGLFLVLIVIGTISTVKYVMSLADHQKITFFTVYQIVIFLLYGFLVFVFLSERKKYLFNSIFLFCTAESILILLFQNRFMLDLGIYRFMGVYTNPNIQGLFAVVNGMLSLYLFAANYRFRFYSIFIFTLSIAVVILTYSRTCLISLLFGLCIIFIFYSYKGNWKRFLKNITIVVLLIFLFVLVFLPRQSDKMKAVIVGDGTAYEKEMEQDNPAKENNDISVEEEKITDKKEEKEISSENNSVILPEEEVKEEIDKRFSLSSDDGNSILHNLRYQIWSTYLNQSSEYFMFGTDYTLNERPVINGVKRDPHNTILYTFFRYGILGAVSLIILLVVVGIKLLFKKEKTTCQITILGCFSSICIISLFNDLLNTPIYFFILGISYIAIQDEENIKSDLKYKPHRILQVFSTVNKGGAESRVMDIYRELDRSEVQFDFIVMTPDPERQFFYHEIVSLGGKVHEIKSWRVLGIRGYFKQWKKVLTENDYQIVHSHVGLDSGLIMYLAWLNHIPKRITHARDSGIYDLSKIRIFYLSVMRILIKIFSTDKIYCSKEAAVHVFGKGELRRKRIYFLPNAINIKLYSTLNEKKIVEIKRELGLYKYDIVVGTVGNAKTVKNHIFLVKVFHKILTFSSKSVLLIVGNDKQDVEVKKYIEKNHLENHVIFTGIRTDIPDILQVFDVFVLPSLSEGAPGSVIEAQASNLPCVLSDTITRDIDVGTGLLKYLSLNLPIEKWSEEIMKSCRMKRPDVNETIQKLYDMGYDSSSSVKKLLEIYNV